MKQKTFNQVVAVLLGIKGVYLVLYMLGAAPISVQDLMNQTWLVLVGLIIDVYLAWTAYKLGFGKK